MTQAFVERYADRLHGVLSRSRPHYCDGDAAWRLLRGRDDKLSYAKGIRIFDSPAIRRAVARSESVSVRRKSAKRTRRSQHRARQQEPTSARKTWWRACWPVRGDAPGLVTRDFDDGEPARAISRGMDKTNGHVFLPARISASVCTITSTSSMRRCWSLLFACSHLGAVRLAVLLQRSQRLGARADAREGIGFAQEDNAFLRIDDLPAGASPGRRLQSRHSASAPQNTTLHWLCPVADVFARRLAFDDPSGRILH